MILSKSGKYFSTKDAAFKHQKTLLGKNIIIKQCDKGFYLEEYPNQDGYMGMMLNSGEIVRTTRGNLTTNFPFFKGYNNRLETQLHEWLVENAKLESQRMGCSYTITLFKGLNPKNLSPCDITSINMLLFDKDYPV
jgi:hypothetical protein